MTHAGDTSEPGSPDRRGRSAAATLGIFAIFLATSLIRAPVPAVNEPHYLGKAKHFWNPAWCAGDFFLESSNPHVVFYAAVGWLTRFLTLEGTAYVGRAAGLLLLAWGWHRLASRLIAGTWGEVASAALFVLLGAVGTFSGEWVIGGIEAKVFAYGLALWSGGCWLDGKRVLAGALAGGAVSFHPVVGVWCLAAAMMAGAWSAAVRLGGGGSRGVGEHLQGDASVAGRTEPRPPGWRRAGLPLAALVLCSLPGMIPALQLVVGVDPELSRQADRIQATARIGHHIDPMLFPFSSYRHYAVLLAVWLLASLMTRGSREMRIANRFVLASVVIAAVGLAIGWSPAWLGEGAEEFKLRLIKFYPFRLADAAIPAVIALLMARAAAGVGEGSGAPRWLPAVLAVGAATTAWLLPAPDANASGMTPERRAAWIRTLHWIRDNTPEGSLVATANEDWAVKWFAQRPEFVNFKDCPQDAAGTVEWRQRRLALVAWSQASKRDGDVSREDLARLHEATGIDYLIVSRYGGLTPEPVYAHGGFRVYRVHK